MSTEALVASPDTQSLPTLDLRGPPLAGLPRAGHPERAGPASHMPAPRHALKGPVPLWGPQERQTESDREQAGAQKSLQLWALTPCGASLRPAGLGPPRACTTTRGPAGTRQVGGCSHGTSGPHRCWSFPSHARGRDTG